MLGVWCLPADSKNILKMLQALNEQAVPATLEEALAPAMAAWLLTPQDVDSLRLAVDGKRQQRLDQHPAKRGPQTVNAADGGLHRPSVARTRGNGGRVAIHQPTRFHAPMRGGRGWQNC